MNVNSIVRRSLLVCAMAFSVMLLADLANATTLWREFQTSIYGYGGDYSEIVKSDIDQYIHIETSRKFPIAVNKTYRLRTGGTLTINSSDTIQDYMTAGNNTDALYQPFFFIGVLAWFLDPPNSDPQYKQKAPHIFLEMQTQLLCPYESYNSSLVVGDGFMTGGADEANVILPYCPEGGFPIYAEAEFWHGIQ